MISIIYEFLFNSRAVDYSPSNIQVDVFNLIRLCDKIPGCIIVTRNGQFGDTGCLNRNLYAMLKFTERSKTPEMTQKHTLLSLTLQGNFAGDFVLIWMKQRLIWFNLQRTKRLNQKWIVYHQGNFCRKFATANVSSAPKYEHLPRLVKLATPDSSLDNLKIYSSKGCKKTSKR